MLNNQGGDAFTDVPFFNKEFIKTNHISKASGHFMVRKPGQFFKNTEYVQSFLFNASGELEMQYETFPDDGTKDTSMSIYKYDQSSNLVTVRMMDPHGFNTIEYKYDSLGQVVELKNIREADTSDTSNTDVLGSYVLNRETYKYSYGDQNVKRTKYNSYNLPYLEENHIYNEDGYLIKIIERQKMTSNSIEYVYEYNNKGLLASIGKSSRSSDKLLEEVLFEYDEFSNIIEKKIFRNGVFTTDVQIIYDNKTKLLSSVITKFIETDIITILRFDDYQYY